MVSPEQATGRNPRKTERRACARIEATTKGLDIRFVVTSLETRLNLGTAVVALVLRSYVPAGKAQTAAMAPKPADLVPLRAEWLDRAKDDQGEPVKCRGQSRFFDGRSRAPPDMGPMAHGFAALGEAAERAVGTLSALAADAAQAPSRLGDVARLLTSDGKLGTVWQVTLPFAGLLLGAVAGALIVSRLLAPQRKTLAALQPSGAASFARGMFRSMIVDAAPVAAFATVAGGGSFLLFWDRGLLFSGTATFRMVASTVISMSVSAWLAVVLLSLPLAVGRPGLRVPLDGREAVATRRFIGQIVGLRAASWIVAVSFYLTWIGKVLPRLLLIFAGLVICAINLRALARIRSRVSGFGRYGTSWLCSAYSGRVRRGSANCCLVAGLRSGRPC
jgi:hypothetical protein